ncbi:hypothetical protein BGZ60DRAFT_436721 [Tricladium varicosporioides]|nr:hypothetical protein BGZ60DRAFT_436721 [Hymenoscyphus varicosporioides]
MGWSICSLMLLSPTILPLNNRNSRMGRPWMKNTAIISGLSTTIIFGLAILMSNGLLMCKTREIDSFILESQPFFIPRTNLAGCNKRDMGIVDYSREDLVMTRLPQSTGHGTADSGFITAQPSEPSSSEQTVAPAKEIDLSD